MYVINQNYTNDNFFNLKDLNHYLTLLNNEFFEEIEFLLLNKIYILNEYINENEIKIFFIEGNIGVGKTTFINSLCLNGQVVKTPEPINLWLSIIDVDTNMNCLQIYYDFIKNNNLKDTNNIIIKFEYITLITRVLCMCNYVFYSKFCKRFICERSFINE